jgi:hypothetical protein
MPWRNGPHARAPAGADRERLPRAIAARLTRAGCIAEVPVSTSATAAANQPRLAVRDLPPDRWSRDVFELIEWRRFEAVVEALFAQAGFETRSQAHGADGGVDIWLYSLNHAHGDAPVSIVQCKQWMRQKVGVKDVREKVMSFAEQNVANSFDFAQKLVRAKDVQEMMVLQQEFLKSQMQAMQAQAKDLGTAAAKATADTTKKKT